MTAPVSPPRIPRDGQARGAYLEARDVRTYNPSSTATLFWVAHVFLDDDSDGYELVGERADTNGRDYRATQDVLLELTTLCIQHGIDFVMFPIHSTFSQEKWITASPFAWMDIPNRATQAGVAAAADAYMQIVANETADALDDAEELLIATDGSFGTSLGSSAFISAEGHYGYQIIKPRCAGPLEAEVAAAVIAMETLAYPMRPLRLLIDSQDAIYLLRQTLRSKPTGNENPRINFWLNRLRTLMDDSAEFPLAYRVRVRRIQGHSGHMLNEMADMIAVQSRRLSIQNNTRHGLKQHLQSLASTPEAFGFTPPHEWEARCVHANTSSVPSRRTLAA